MTKKVKKKAAPPPQQEGMQLVKWAGGKAWLLENYAHLLPAPGSFERYHEPFLGGGAVARHYLGKADCYLSDKNARLIAVYDGVRRYPQQVWSILRDLREHARPDPEGHYYKIRKLFNDDPGKDVALRAARFIWLNRTCYRGLYRENQKGEFNVPWGDYSYPPALPSEADIMRWHASMENCSLYASHYRAVDAAITSRSFVFLDPPYVPISKTANFTQYVADGFGPVDQKDLSRWLIDLDIRGAKFLLTNNAEAKKLYADRWDILEVEVARSMSDGSNKKRGKVKEILVANYSIS